MQRRRAAVVVLVFWLFAPAAARADRVDDYVRARIKEFQLPGLSLLVIRDGAIVKAAGYGLADVERRIPAQPQTVYKIGSVSKQFIATGIMRLVQEGRLGLDHPISRYLAGTPVTWSGITIRHLLTHTSGLIREAPGFDPSRIQSDADVIRTAYSAPLRFAPGEKWEYSNLGYFALAEVIRAVSGQPWSEYLAANVFRPTGMFSTRTTAESVPDLAQGIRWYFDMPPPTGRSRLRRIRTDRLTISRGS